MEQSDFQDMLLVAQGAATHPKAVLLAIPIQLAVLRGTNKLEFNVTAPTTAVLGNLVVSLT
jgi:hypothetical protein